MRHEFSPFLIHENIILYWVWKEVVAVIQCQDAVEGGKVKRTSKCCSSRSGLQCQVGRMHRLGGRCYYTERVGAAAPVCLWNTLQQTFWNWLVTLLVTRSSLGSFSVACIWSYLTNKLLAGATITQGGVLPNIQAVLVPKKNENKA